MASMGTSPEEIRLRYLYRSVIMRGKGRLPLEAARKLVGPDCAYHLYPAMTGGSPSAANPPCEALQVEEPPWK